MNRILNLLEKRRKAANPWIKKGISLLIVAFVANHLMEIDSFPLSDSYTFPLLPIFTSLIIGGVILLIADLNFNYFERKHFTKEITTKTLTFYLLSTFGYITILYIPCFYVVVWLHDGDYRIYYLIFGLSITLLISALAIIILYAQKLYNLHKLETLTGRFIIQQANNKISLKTSEIAYFYSENKIVYVVLFNGEKLSTDFTLTEVESKTNKQLFLRANRQTLIQAHSVKEIKAIENGKLLVTLLPASSGKQDMQIVVSRYKKKEFNEWFQNKQEY